MPCVVMAFCLLFVVVCSAYDSAMVLGASQGFNVSESQDTWTGLKRGEVDSFDRYRGLCVGVCVRVCVWVCV